MAKQKTKFYDMVFDADKRAANQNAMKLAEFLQVGQLQKLEGLEYPAQQPQNA